MTDKNLTHVTTYKGVDIWLRDGCYVSLYTKGYKTIASCKRAITNFWNEYFVWTKSLYQEQK
jgi:hypothetical protein